MRRLIIIAFLLYVGTLLLLSCNAVKRVNKDTEKQLKVIQDYSKKFPSVNDTTRIYIPGETITTETTKYDTSYKYITANCPPEKTIYKDRLKITTIHDTIVKTIIDRSKERAFQDAAWASELSYKSDIKIANDKADDFKDKRDYWRKRFFILLAISIVAVFLAIKLF